MRRGWANTMQAIAQRLAVSGIGACLAFMVLFCVEVKSAKADVLNDAYEFYSTYGNRTVFIPTSATDGELCFGTRAGLATSWVVVGYETIGWQVYITNSSGQVLQRINYTRGGAYLVDRSCRVLGNMEYNLYTLKLSTIMSMLNATAREAVNNGTASMKLNACMIVEKYGVPSGSMDAYGNIYGQVYTDYNGMCNSFYWSDGAKWDFLAYYNKAIENIYRTLTLSKGTGVSSVRGAGSYIYGSKINIEATMQTGYLFSYWSGSSVYYTNRQEVIMSNNYSLTAYGRASYSKITFYRNRDSQDTEKFTKTCYYGGSNNYYINPGWNKEGYQLIGWSRDRNSASAQYQLNQAISNDYIWNHQQGDNLYGIWRPNAYSIRYQIERAATPTGPINTGFEGDVTIDNSMINADTGLPVLYWTLNQDGTGNRYKPGEIVAVSALAREAGVSYLNGATIVLYGTWASAPQIQAGDYYFSLEEAKNGRLTEEVFASYIRCVDEFDGDIAYGRGSSELYIENFSADRYLGAEEEGVFEERIIAKNSLGYTTERLVYVHLVDTSIKTVESNLRKRIRFISKDYIFDENGELLTERDGGLPEGSLWRKNAEYLQLLNGIY